jgi:S-adenosylmethionine hydrolase
LDKAGNLRRRSRIISLLSDFGNKDAYVSAMKGVILGICPEVTLVDISHEVKKHDIVDGAFTLSEVSPYFPEGTVHLAVVDPGVGTDRRRIIIQGRRCSYVGPDNGVLSLAANREGVVKVFEILNRRFMLPRISWTFEGRDVFAPIAAHLARGVDINSFGPEISSYSSLVISEPAKRGRLLLGEVIRIDSFGNITTNIPETVLEELALDSSVEVAFGETSKTCPFRRTYGEVPVGSPLVTLGSSGFLEVAVNRGSAESLFQVKVGDGVTLLPL